MKILNLSIILLLTLGSLSSCAKDGSIAGKKWDVGVQPPEQMNRNDAYTYQSKDDYCTKELKARKGC